MAARWTTRLRPYKGDAGSVIDYSRTTLFLQRNKARMERRLQVDADLEKWRLGLRGGPECWGAGKKADGFKNNERIQQSGHENDSNLARHSCCCRHSRYSVPAKYKGTDGHHIVLPTRNGRNVVVWRTCIEVTRFTAEGEQPPDAYVHATAETERAVNQFTRNRIGSAIKLSRALFIQAKAPASSQERGNSGRGEKFHPYARREIQAGNVTSRGCEVRRNAS